MFSQRRYPQQLPADELDRYLEQGWFRIGQTIFTTNFLHFHNRLYSAVWLRSDLQKFQTDKKLGKLMKANGKFRSEIVPASITPAQEALYSKYRQSISFNPSGSVFDLLFGNATTNVYNTYEVNLYHDEDLIACGFFDVGSESAAGITSFYDPAYKKYSLGKYLIYLKMMYCRTIGLRYFYPGYFVPGYRFFDYKLDIGTSSLEYLQLASGKWFPVKDFLPEESPVVVMREKLLKFQKYLLRSNIPGTLFNYEFFEANLYPELQGEPLFDYPVFLMLTENDAQLPLLLIIYDIVTARYHLLSCMSIWKTNVPATTPESYTTHLLKLSENLFAAADPQELLEFISTRLSFRIQA